MKRVYRRPWIKAVEIKQCNMVCTSEDDEVKSMSIELNDYSTYSGTGINSDF